MGDTRLQNFVWETPEERLWREGRGAALELEALAEARDQGRWAEAVERAGALVDAVTALARLDGADAAGFWRETGTAIAALIDALHPLLVINSATPLPDPDRAELCWQLSALLDRLLTTPAPLPPRLAGMHTHLLLYGGIYWRKRHQAGEQGPEGMALERAAHLFARAASRLDPLPDWLSQACAQLGITPMADPSPGAAAAAQASEAPAPASSSAAPHAADAVAAQAPPESSSASPAEPAAPRLTAPVCPPSRLWPPSQLAEELEQWLLDAGPGRPVRLGLACVPGAAMLCREGPRLEFNIAALLEDPSGVAPDPWLMALRDPLQRALAGGWLQQLELREPFSSLYESLSHHWRLGGLLPPRHLQRLPAVLDAWQRLLGPGQLQAQRLPGSLSGGASSRDASARLQVRLDLLELAALSACDPGRHASPAEAHQVIEAVLARLRREHLNERFWAAEAPAAAELAADPLEALRLLHRDAGFYASSADGPACVHAWREGSLACLQRAQLWADEQAVGAPALLQLGQCLTQRSGRVPALQQRPPLVELLERLGGLEVLYVGWAAGPVLEQHRSGRAFRLFDDRSIVPYGLRAVAMPESRHPRRPDGGFRDSLDQLVAAVEREHAARPVQLLLVDEGAYRLPLLERIERRHGLAAVAPGPELVQLFGLDRPGLSRWRQESRHPDAWRILS